MASEPKAATLKAVHLPLEIPSTLQLCMCMRVCIYIYMVTPPPPHDRPSPLKHRPHRRIRAFPEVSSFSPDFVCPEPHPGQNQKNKNPKSHGECGDSFGFLDFWIFVFWIFAFLFFWFCYVKTKNPKIQKNKNPKIQNCPHILRETLDFGVFWFWVHPCSSHGLCLYTNNNTIIEVKLNTNTPMNTSTHSNGDIRTNWYY